MIKYKPLVAVAAMLGLTTPAAQAQSNLKIGIIATLSGPPAVLGQQLRNGFALAVKDLGGKLGGVDTEIVVADDELKPDVAVSKVKALIERDKVDFVVGPIFSNILGAIEKPVTEAGVILISPNAGTSTFAGKECNPNLFVTSYQNDQVHEVLGQYAEDSGIKKVVVIVPNYQAGRTPPRASSTNSPAKCSTRCMFRSASSTIRRSCRGSPPPSPTPSSPFCPAAWV